MNIYQEEILEHYRHPCCQEKIKNPTHHSCNENSTCGDKLCLTLKIKKNKIEKISFTGEGCAISQASASMLCEQIDGQKIEKLKKMTKDDVIAMLGIELSPTRLKCGLLALETAQKSLKMKLKKNKL
jgi:nitrogen fixation NifU-like protein